MTVQKREAAGATLPPLKDQCRRQVPEAIRLARQA